jgi:hypothetical protein
LGDGLLGSEIVKQTDWSLISRKKNGFDINVKTIYDGKLKDDLFFITNKGRIFKINGWKINKKFMKTSA